MNNKGFTLVELIGIVLILALIFLVSFPNFVSMSKISDEKRYENMVKDLCMAGESYIYANGMSVDSGGIQISIKDLIDYGNVDKNLKDVKTGESVKDKTLIFTKNSDGTLNCNY